jgi:hypothetical protein
MHFFRAREAADHWRTSRTGIAMLTVEQGFELAHARWIDRKRAAEERRDRVGAAHCVHS